MGSSLEYPLAQETHSSVTAVQFCKKPTESVLQFVTRNGVQLFGTAWKLKLPGIDAADSGPLDQPILQAGTDDNQPLTTTPVTNEQQ